MHIMIDIETLSTKENATVLSVGAAAFEWHGNDIADSFEVHIDPMDSARYGTLIDPSTVMWWLHPDRHEARDALMSATRFDLGTALEGFYQWLMVAAPEIEGVWGNGATFDNVILRKLHDSAGVPCPWAWYVDRCYRTMKSLPGAPAMVKREGVHHAAVDDAISQALHLQSIVRELEL